MYEKIGLHIIEGHPYSIEGSPILTLLNPSVEYVHQLRAQLGHDALLVIRFYDGMPSGDEDPASVAQFMTAQRAQMMIQMRHSRNVFQGLNEPQMPAEWLREFELERLRILHDRGLRAAVLSPSVGHFSLEKWSILRPVLEALRPGDVVSVHEYWAERKDIDDPFLCGRWRIIEELGDLPIAVTECGRDVIGSRGARGWKASNTPIEVYLEEIEAYNQLLMAFPNVVGGTLFTVGRMGSRWRDYDAADPYKVIVQERGSVPPPPPPPPEDSHEQRMAKLEKEMEVVKSVLDHLTVLNAKLVVYK